MEIEREVIEFEVGGVLINRVTKDKSEAVEIITNFYELHGRRGSAYYIRQSKMNFKNLMED